MQPVMIGKYCFTQYPLPDEYVLLRAAPDTGSGKIVFPTFAEVIQLGAPVCGGAPPVPAVAAESQASVERSTGVVGEEPLVERLGIAVELVLLIVLVAQVPSEP